MHLKDISIIAFGHLLNSKWNNNLQNYRLDIVTIVYYNEIGITRNLKNLPLLLSRQDNRISVILSEESKRIRVRNHTVNIQMTFISWLLELIAGLSGLSVTFTLFLQRSVNPIIFKSVMLLDMPLNFILIPLS